MLGLSARTASRVLAQLLKDRLLASAVTFAFPLDALHLLLPNLYPEASALDIDSWPLPAKTAGEALLRAFPWFCTPAHAFQNAPSQPVRRERQQLPLFAAMLRTSGSQRLLSVAASPRTYGLGPIAVSQASRPRRRKRPVSDVLLTYPVSALGRKRRDQSSDCCSLRRTHASDPLRSPTCSHLRNYGPEGTNTIFCGALSSRSQTGGCFESKHLAVGSFDMPAFVDPGTAQPRGTDTLCGTAKPSHQITVRQRHQ
jgi:hypothetical protein